MYSVTITEKTGKKTVREFDQAEISIGRILGNDIVLPKANISKRHAHITREGSDFVLTDEKSTNGTFINGKRIQESYTLSPGDKIFVGEFVLEIAEGEEKGVPAPPPPAPPGARADALPRETAQLSRDQVLNDQEWGGASHAPGSDWEKGWNDADNKATGILEDVSNIAHAPTREPERKAEASPLAAANDLLGADDLPALKKPAAKAAAARAPAAPIADGASSPARLVHQYLVNLWPSQLAGPCGPTVDAKLETVVNQAVKQLAADKAFGSGAKTDGVAAAVLDELREFGPLAELVADEEVQEIFVNRGSQIYVRRRGQVEAATARFSCDEAVANFARRLAVRAGQVAAASSPLIDVRLDGGFRLSAVLPPLAFPGASLALRKIRFEPIQIDELVASGALTANMAEFLDLCMRAHRTVVASGLAGSGKTTTLNVLACYAPPTDRIVTIEGVGELSIEQANVIRLEAAPLAMQSNEQAAIDRLLAFAQLLAPERLIVGQCHGPETLEVLRLMISGPHSVLTSVQATGPEAALQTLATLALGAPHAPSAAAVHALVAQGVHVVIHHQRFADGVRRIMRICEIAVGGQGELECKDLFVFEPDGAGLSAGRFKAMGTVPAFCKALAAAGIEADLTIFESA